WVGLTEMTWLTPTPLKKMVDYVYRSVGGIRPETTEGWRALLAEAGLRDVAGNACRLRILSQMVQEIRTFDAGDVARACLRFPGLMASRAGRRALRGLARDAWDMPRGLFEHFGYGIYTGRKISSTLML
ncbi:MAG: hypothetical protein GY953_40450, partial [bacterium]|nr:hypothetical protein [bacterium]